MVSLADRRRAVEYLERKHQVSERRACEVVAVARSTKRRPGTSTTWLYLHSPESIKSLRRVVDFYVHQHNQVMPHAAFQGQTPGEMFYGTGDAVVVKLSAARIKAREARISSNRTAQCGVCKSDSSSRALRLQRPRSRMS